MAAVIPHGFTLRPEQDYGQSSFFDSFLTHKTCGCERCVVDYSYTTTLLLHAKEMETFNTGLVMRITEASARQLDYWSWTGFVQPSGIAGRKRKYSLDDVVRIAAVMRLKEAGLSLQAIRKALNKLRQHHQDPLRELKLVAYRGNVYVYGSTEEAYRAVDGQATFLFMDVGKVAEQTEALLKSFS